EFKLLAEIFAKTLPPAYPYAVKGGQQEIKAVDFDDRVDILPVSDPNIFSMSQRVMLAQQELQMAQAAPDIHNLREAYKRMYEALEVKNGRASLRSNKNGESLSPTSISAGWLSCAFE
ncbi:MAG: hypothetical protein CL430_03975, partial [Acidimicrobiaceae bacterium]|nr:hypothetical protein [Acidimicrobiaceae bacterium]